ncbi:choice-of-anchor G family protein, partial [Nesterenkonia sp. K-15-9-6]|uniref:choice-of-anchor G family protein n=1 Tax=Nesterenkonia sp. K-15-9-6 TaxID=3093918 RepID=UPI004043ADC8
DQDGVGGLGQYRVGEASVLLTSPAVEEAAAMIYDTIGEIDATMEDTVNDLLDVADLISVIPGASLSAEVSSNMQEEIFAAILAEPITTNNQVLTVDFSTGTAQLHLDQLLSGELRPGQPTGMNNQNPNTELIDDEIYPMIAETVHDLMEEVTNITVGAIEGALASVTIDYEATLGGATATGSLNLMGDEINEFECSGGLPGVCATLSAVTGLLQEAVVPVRDFVISDAGQEIFDLLIRDIKTGAITVPIREALEPFIETLATVVSVQLNHQVEEYCETPEGEQRLSSLEVSALSIGLFEGDGARLNFGNAGARVDSCGLFEQLELGLVVDPDSVPAGESTQVTGEGFTPDASATVQLVDPEGNPVGEPVPAETDEAGGFTVELPTPGDAEPGEYSVVAVDDTTGQEISEGLSITDPDDDGVIDPSLVVDPDSVPAG